MRYLTTVGAFTLLFVVLGTGTAAAADPPPWLRQAAQLPTPTTDRSAPAVVLQNEQRVTIEEDGRVVTTTSYAVRILTRAGRPAATGGDVYRTDSGKIRDLRAWLIPAQSGNVREYGKGESVDLALVNNDVYNEVRMKRIGAEDAADVGSVFGYESTNEDRAVFTQFEFEFQQRLPVLVSRFTLTVPRTWSVEGVTFNHSDIKPVINGSTYSWELRSLPGIDQEPASPELTSLVARLAVSAFPPGNSNAPVVRFATWQDVSKWLTALNDPQVVLNDALASKAKALAASGSTAFEQISAIGKFVQSIQYISIQTGIGRGGGYRPHTSAEVFDKAYGDCKDKANLMRAMLKAIGILSYPVAIYSGDPDYVREEWPSPQQFNHAIIAIPFDQDIRLSSTLNHPALGRLLLFDPTDTETAMGELPDHEQGSFALLVAGDRGELARMPVTSPESNRVERNVDGVLGANGALTAKVREHFFGGTAVDARREFRAGTRSDYDKRIEAWIVRGVSGAKVSKIDVNETPGGPFTLQTEFSADQYGQLMQNRLLIFKPAIVSRRASLFLTEASRKYPVLLGAQAYTESVRIKLPDGFQVDELPEPLKMEEVFGGYSANHKIEDGYLLFTRSLTIRRSLLPVDQYSSVRSFYQKILAMEQSPAVLIRKNTN